MSRKCISDIFVPDETEKMLIVTYEYDPGLLRKIFSQDSDVNALSNIQGIEPVIIYDAIKTGQLGKDNKYCVPLFQAPKGGVHHSKSYLILEKEKVKLIFGSFNFTESGVFSNRETFVQIEVSKEQNQGANLLETYIKFTEDNYIKGSNSVNSKLKLLLDKTREKIRPWKTAGKDNQNPSYTLLHSGYTESSKGINTLKKLWNTEGKPSSPATHIICVTPFFDKNENKNNFQYFTENELITPDTEFHLITAYNRNANYPFSKELIEAVKNTFNRNKLFLYLADYESSKSELEEITKMNKISKDAAIYRSLHSKILILYDDKTKKALMYFGSANFTRKAWSGINRELGIAYNENNCTFQELLNDIKKNLYASKKTISSDENIFEPKEPPNYEDELNGHFPVFIDSIYLLLKKENEFFVRIFIANENKDAADKIDLYNFYWGETELKTWELTANEYADSNITEISGNTSLIFNKNMKIVLKANDEIFYYLPINYSEDIAEILPRYIFTDSEDWFDKYSQKRNYEYDPYGSENGTEDEPEGRKKRNNDDEELKAKTERGKNVIVSMQIFLNNLSYIENDIIKNIDKHKSANETFNGNLIWDPKVDKSLANLHTILLDELSKSEIYTKEYASSLFKISELIITAIRITHYGRKVKNVLSNDKFNELKEILLHKTEDLKKLYEDNNYINKTFIKAYFENIIERKVNELQEP